MYRYVYYLLTLSSSGIRIGAENGITKEKDIRLDSADKVFM